MSSDPSAPKGVGQTKSILNFKAPPDPATLRALIRRPKKRVKVLDEDDYVEKVERIIEKDFFPELERLNAQAEYLEAAERKDHDTMNRLRERFSTSSSVHRNRHRDPLERLETPATFETPQDVRREQDASSEFGNSTLNTPRKDDDESISAPSIAEKKEEKHISLDKFMRNHTSEDNESFYELMEESKAEFKRTHQWMFKNEEQLSIEDKRNQLALPSIENQAKGLDSESKYGKPLDGWTYQNVNSVFYHPDGAAFSNDEKIERAKKEKLIYHENTRFSSNPWKSDVSQSNLKLTATLRKEANLGKVGVDGKELVDPTKTPSVNGYSMLRIADPSPMVAPDESPLMTWGEVESTPYRLDGCETPLPVYTGDGPSFKIQDIPKRDRIAHELAEKNSKFYRDKKIKAIQQARSNIKTPKTSSLSTRVATMSPAAMRLATSKLGIRLGTDKALKASYTPSPMRSPRKEITPKMSARSSVPSSIRLTLKGNRTPGTPSLYSSRIQDPTSLTDDLLNLPSSSKPRPKASDFMT